MAMGDWEGAIEAAHRCLGLDANCFDAHFIMVLQKLARTGQSQEVEASLSVPDKTIAGDYVTNFTAKNSFATADAAFRMTVKTSLLSGWIGIMVILLALATVYYLVRKYGRR